MTVMRSDIGNQNYNESFRPSKTDQSSTAYIASKDMDASGFPSKKQSGFPALHQGRSHHRLHPVRSLESVPLPTI